MTRRIRMIFVVPAVLTFLLAAPGVCQFYRYTDESGNVRYTDDLSQVPPDQIKKAKGYVELKEAGSNPAPDRAATPTETPAVEVGPDTDLEATAKQLQAMKEELQQEYQTLLQMQKSLQLEKGQNVTQNKYKARQYKEKQAAFAKQHQTYEAKRKAYEEAVNAYNAQVEARGQAASKTE